MHNGCQPDGPLGPLSLYKAYLSGTNGFLFKNSVPHLFPLTCLPAGTRTACGRHKKSTCEMSVGALNALVGRQGLEPRTY